MCIFNSFSLFKCVLNMNSLWNSEGNFKIYQALIGCESKASPTSSLNLAFQFSVPEAETSNITVF